MAISCVVGAVSQACAALVAQRAWRPLCGSSALLSKFRPLLTRITDCKPGALSHRRADERDDMQRNEEEDRGGHERQKFFFDLLKKTCSLQPPFAPGSAA
jgi:hypothetical protein